MRHFLNKEYWMTGAKNRSAHVFLAVILILFFINPVKATAMSFIVKAGQVETKTINLAVEDHVTIEFTVTGHATGELRFHITDPYGNVEKDFGVTSDVNYQFVCSEEGEYTLYFSNTGSTEDKLVSLDYEIQHYILGIPQMLFLTLIVLGICLAAVTVFVLMGKPR